jgi:hypothetical protein
LRVFTINLVKVEKFGQHDSHSDSFLGTEGVLLWFWWSHGIVDFYLLWHHTLLPVYVQHISKFIKKFLHTNMSWVFELSMTPFIHVSFTIHLLSLWHKHYMIYLLERHVSSPCLLLCLHPTVCWQLLRGPVQQKVPLQRPISIVAGLDIFQKIVSLTIQRSW